MHISKIPFLFPVSFTIEYKVGIAEFYLYMGYGADLLKNMVTRAWKLRKLASAHLQNWETASGLSHRQQTSKRPHFWAACKIMWKSVKNCGHNRSTTDLFTKTPTDGKNWLLGLSCALDRLWKIMHKITSGSVVTTDNMTCWHLAKCDTTWKITFEHSGRRWIILKVSHAHQKWRHLIGHISAILMEHWPVTDKHWAYCTSIVLCGKIYEKQRYSHIIVPQFVFGPLTTPITTDSTNM